MKKIKMLISVIVILVAAFLYSHVSKMNMIYNKDIDNSEYLNMGEIDEKKVEQSFVCKEDSLDGVYIKCQLVGDVSEAMVYYTISDKADGSILREGKSRASELKDTKFNSFMLDTIEECKDRELFLTIWSESKNDIGGVTFYFESDIEDGTELYLDGNNMQGTMIMKTITNRFDIETFCVLLVFILFIVGFMKILYKLFA